MKKILIMVLALVMAFPVFAYADTPRITFDNLKEDQPDLYITKTVETALDGYTAPDTDFTFVLKWDEDGDGRLEFAENAEYIVYDEYGQQTGVFHTTSTGRFTLKAGQTARFEWAGQVEYEITEINTEGYTQTVPAGGESATGTVSASGTMVEFENTYIPVTDSEETMLAIRKDISWPYEAPDFSGFMFQVTIDGKAYAYEPYTVYNADMTEVLGTGRTDGKGAFTMDSSQTVVFEGVAVGVDYKVEEVLEDGWRAVGTAVYEGSTTSPIVYAYFTNAGASFVVEKERSDGITGGEFSFTLTDGEGNALPGVEYFLYDDALLGSGTTDENGCFTLAAGEKAVFVGFNEGDGFAVTENAEGFAVSPAEGYTGTSYDTLLFTNTQLGNITIKKAEKGNVNHLLAGAEFTLYALKDDEYEEYEVLVTGEDGTLTFADLPNGSYMIKETAVPEGYVLNGNEIYVEIPYVISSSEAARLDTEGFLYKASEDAYYIYDMTYDVFNTHAVMELPETGGKRYILLILFGGVAACLAVVIYRRKCQ